MKIFYVFRFAALAILLTFPVELFAVSNRDKECPIVINLDSGWQFRAAGAEKWYPASVPGCVHTDLLNNNLIEDPFFRLNEKSLQWIGETNWEYKSAITLSSNILTRSHIQLLFEGLDTYADVYFNDQLVLKADNMFREWSVEVRALCKPGLNTIRIYFHNVFETNLPKYRNAPYRLESFPNNDQADVQLAVYSRKAGYEYGWDWGPRLITCGLWKPVQLKAWNTAKIDALNVIQNSVSGEVADLTAVFEINASTATNAVLNLVLDGDRMSSSAIALASGFNKIPVNFKIKKPNLWWSNGLGTHYLYSIQGQLMIGGNVADESTVKTGIRSLRVVRTNDAAGQSFYVELNGLPVFMKGASYIPQDNFANRITADRYETMVKSAADANMNMLRVWGGGFYPDDKFYEACDQYGVLVWQDMMFACGMFPDSEEFVQSVTNEITDNIIRLRNHPCIALYNGNNENEISWHSWGWKAEYSEPVQRDYETSMSNLFRAAIPAAIGKADNTRYYHPTSPSVGYLEKPVTEGDMHYWGVWHGKEPFSEYNDLKHIARFMSEYGFQSYPDFSTILKFSTSEGWDIHTLTMLAHQRCMADGRKDVEYGNRLIQHYMDNDYRRAKDFRSFIYLSQVCQADGVKIAAEAHRRHMTDQFCMGSLYWQLDDCWPAASWSSIDYYGNWKALHYYAAKFFKPTILSAIEENGEYRIYGISDRTNAEKAQLGVKIIGLRGEIIKEDKRDVVLGPNTSAVIYSTDVTNLFAGIDKKSAFVWLTLTRGNKEIYSDLKSILPLKEVHLFKPKISVKMKPGDVNCQMELATDVVAKNVYVTLVDKTGKPMAVNFTDNYFDLVPGEVKRIQLREHSKPDGKVEKVEVISLVDTYD